MSQEKSKEEYHVQLSLLMNKYVSTGQKELFPDIFNLFSDYITQTNAVEDEESFEFINEHIGFFSGNLQASLSARWALKTQEVIDSCQEFDDEQYSFLNASRITACGILANCGIVDIPEMRQIKQNKNLEEVLWVQYEDDQHEDIDLTQNPKIKYSLSNLCLN